MEGRPKTWTSGNATSTLARGHVIEALVVLAAVPYLAFIAVSAARQGPLTLITERPHIILAGLSQATAWLVSLAVIYSRRVSSGHAPLPLHLRLLWHAQPVVAAAVAVPALCYWSMGPEVIPLLISSAVELLFVAALDWELISRQKDRPGIQEQLLPQDEEGQDRPSWASQLAFAWVTPLMSVGSHRRLEQEDLLDLPPELQPAECRRIMWANWKQAGQSTKGGVEGNGTAVAKLWPALWGAYGWPYVSLGLLKLFGDTLNFAGMILSSMSILFISWPLLLNALLKHMKEARSRGGAGRDGHEVVVGGEPPAYPLWIPAPGTLAYGCGCVALLGLAAVLKAVLNTQYSFKQGALACRLRSALTCLVYDKTLLVSSVDMAAHSSGAVQTLMSVDSDRIVNLFSSLHELWSLPLQIAIALCLLYMQVRLAFLAGLAVVLALIPVNRWLATRIEAASAEMMECKDVRVRRTGELLRGIRQIKAAALEPAFLARVEGARQGELAALAVRKYLDALCVYFWGATSLLTSILTFSLFVLLGHALTAEVVFTSLALFGVLIAPLNSFPWVINGCVEAIVSVRRLERFLSARETNAQWTATVPEGPQPTPEGRLRLPSPGSALTLPFPSLFGDFEGDGDRLALSAAVEPLYAPVPGKRLSVGQSAAGCAVLFQDASFTWVRAEAGSVVSRSQGDTSQQGDGGSRDVVFRSIVSWWPSDLALTELCLALPFGSLTAVVGDGVTGRVRVCGSLAYVPQQPWIMSGTLRDNIIFKRPYEEARYAAVLAACCLEADLRALPAADQTWVGDRGTTLSGGQCARLALARAIYQDSDVYLLDDVLAAVDAPVAAELWESAICGDLLRGKTRLIVTHSRRYAAAADTLLRLEGGRIAYLGTPEEDPYGLQLWTPGIQPDTEEVDKGKAKLHESFKRRMASSMPTPTTGLLRSPPGPAAKRTKAIEVKDQVPAPQQQPGPVPDQTADQGQPAIPEDVHGEEEEEARHSGHVKGRVYTAYAMAAGPFLVSVILVSLTLMQVTQNGSDLWLSYWVSHEHQEEIELAHALGAFNGTPLEQKAYPPWQAMPTFQPSLPASSGYVWLPQSGYIWGTSDFPHAGVWNPKEGFREGNVSTGQSLDTGQALSEGSIPAKGVAINKESREGPGIPDELGWHVSRRLKEVPRALHSKFAAAELARNGTRAIGAGGNGNVSAGLQPDRTSREWMADTIMAVRDYLLDQADAVRRSMRRSVAELQPDVQFYLSVLLMLTLANSLSILVRAFSFASGGLAAAQRLHERLLAAVAAAPAAFFGATPGGRILNRFSSDTATADDSLPFILNILLAVLFSMLGVVAVLTYSQPLLAMAFIPLALIYRWLQGYYRSSAREIRRLGSVARSPLYAGFSEALDGAATIRGFRAQAAFARQNVDRLSALQRANFAGLAAAQWLSLRLQVLAASVITLVAALGVAGNEGLLPSIATQAHGTAGAGLVGLSLSYALAITGLLNSLLTSFAETEQEMVAVERILEYIDLEPQEDTRHDDNSEEEHAVTLPNSWPDQGRISYVDVRLRYHRDAPLALNGLSLDILPGQKLGICGRTGAGKSSLVTALLRLSEIEGGAILVDGHNIAGIPLARLRSAIGSVPQTPFLFQGTIRDNLDPMGRHSDRELIGVLKVTRLWDILCGLSLSQAKGSAQRSSPLPTRRVPSAASTPQHSVSRTPPNTYGTPPRSPQMGRPIPPRHRPSSAPSTSYLPVPVESPSSSERTSLLADEGRAATSTAYTGEPYQTPGGFRGRPAPRSRFFGGGGGGSSFAESLARESTGVLVHSGFGGQLLSVSLGEGGVGLSQGQQQLLCLARVLLRRPRIVCLDECTANVDAVTARLMQDLIATQLTHATVLQVAHKLESIMGCSAVVVMEEGRVVEMGAPMQLLATKGSHFAAMHKAAAAQAGSIAVATP
ncbi:probable multidrug resistance-associated protein 7 [Coccomyxa sp. Obi]|nr:probable multidrug resistance-associated protein 7 [Coccomyxa sp. Obi]